jgi:hypothetical protein
MQFPMDLNLRRSWQLAAALAALHGLALLSLVPVTIPLWAKLLLSFVILASLVHGLRRHALRLSPRAVLALRLHADGKLELRRRDGVGVAGSVSPQSCIFPGLVVLLVTGEDERRPTALTLLPDALAKDELRQLRSWLRWKAGDGAT